MVFFELTSDGEESQRHPGLAVLAVPCSSPHTVPVSNERADVRNNVNMKPLEAIRCTHPTCPCECFAPGKQSLRYCDTCSHGWVSHAMDKLGTNHLMNLGLQVEVVQPNIVFDIASLMLYGAHATPVRLKILLDRLFSVLQHEEVLQVLHGFGWTYEDYARGYILQDSSGRVLDKWCVATREEELVVLQQFLRFGETKAIAQEIILQDTKDRHEVLVKQTSRAESDIKKFIERSNMSMQNYIKSYESTRQLFSGRPVPFIPPGAPLISSTPLISRSYSPSRDSQTSTNTQALTTATKTTSAITPPLNILQVMQPFDARHDQSSPAAAVTISPISLEKTPVARKPSPACDSPKNLSLTSPSVSSTAPSPSQPALLQKTLPKLQGMDEVDGVVLSASEDEEVLDFSTRDNPESPSDIDKKNKQHMRKSSNPIKRQWTPSASFGSTLVGPNGKKRVLCTACNKTFCDKGALKIHYSAVHLKEMHKCSVEGCNMMFSSRRSRNRHSANPNPKLHMPQKRKEELEQQEERELAAAQASMNLPKIAATTSSPSIAAVPAVVSHPPTLPILEAPGIVRTDANFFLEMQAQFPFFPPPEKRAKLDEEQPTDLSKISKTIANVAAVTASSSGSSSSEEGPCDLSKKLDSGEKKLEIDLDAHTDDQDESSQDGEMDHNVEGPRPEATGPSMTMNLASANGNGGGNRRKSNAPTRLAQKDTSASSVDMDEEESGKDMSDIAPNNETTKSMTNGKTVSSADNKEITSNNSIQQDDQADKKSENTEAKNFPKIASLLCTNGTSTETAKMQNNPSEDNAVKVYDANDDDDDDDDEDITEVDLDADDLSGKDSSEEVDTNEIMQNYPPDVYLDPENSLKCKVCGKTFHNSFTVKLHFQNVHLKVMHQCSVDGCTATFPSKRSRDRHSANINLHRRILAEENNALEEMDNAIRGNILAKLYGQDLVGNSGTDGTVPVDITSVALININNNNDAKKDNNEKEEIKTVNSKPEKVGSAAALKLPIQNGLNGHSNKAGSAGSEAVSDDSEGEQEEDSDKGELLPIEPFKMACHVCGDTFSNPLVLQEHIGIAHTDSSGDQPEISLPKAMSPRQIRNRQKQVTPVRNRVSTRKTSSS